jgi:ABC-type glycerol-3-phosphate transport system substrate-binding protein
MIDANGGFTGSTGTAVTLKLVTGGTLLPSILSGKGPDVYIGLASADVINYAIRDAVIGVSGNDSRLTAEQNAVFSNTIYTFKDEANHKFYTLNPADYETPEAYSAAYADYSSKYPISYVSQDFVSNVNGNYVDAAMDTVTLLDVAYGIPQTMTFAMMFYRMDVLAELGQEVPETWNGILSMLPVLQTNNMSMGVAYISALDFMMYQRGGNMWKYTDIPEYAGAQIDLDSDIALEAFDFVCSLYSDYSFPISYDASNRFRTGEMPIIIGDYVSLYNTLVVYATEIDGLWSVCPLPGSELEDGSVNYNSLAGVGATVILHGCDQLLSAWQFLQWQSSADVQANYGNRMVALIGPSAKYEAANINAIKNLSWTATERAAIEDQMANLSSIVNYPGSYIISRYMKFAFLDAVNDGIEPVDAMTSYIDAINTELTRKREEFAESGIKTLKPGETPPGVTVS